MSDAIRRHQATVSHKLLDSIEPSGLILPMPKFFQIISLEPICNRFNCQLAVGVLPNSGLTLYVLNLSEGTKTYSYILHLMSFLRIDTTRVVETLPQARQEPTYST